MTSYDTSIGSRPDRNSSRQGALGRACTDQSVSDTSFLHQDVSDGRRVLGWRRGGPGDDPVVVVANFSEWVGREPLYRWEKVYALAMTG
jgi:hypothetical protein